MGKAGIARERNITMITPTIKKEVRDGARSTRRTARSTVRRAPLAPKKEISNNGALSAYGTARSTVKGAPLSRAELDKIDAYWRASLYLSVGMLYLKDNPLLRKPLKVEQTVAGSALARFEPGMSLVDDIDAPLAALRRTIRQYLSRFSATSPN